MSRKAGGVFDAGIKEKVAGRARGRCEICGGAGTVWHFHHRRPRGMGGTARADSGGPANALLLHPSCHERLERNRANAYELGWLVAQQDDPRTVPVRMWDGWAYLKDDGTLTPGGGTDI